MCVLMESVTQQHELVRSSCSTSVDNNRSGPELTKLKIYIHVPETFFNNYKTVMYVETLAETCMYMHGDR